LLDFIGDIGGLFDGLRLLASALIAPLAHFTLKSELFTQLTEGVLGRGSTKSDSLPSIRGEIRSDSATTGNIAVNESGILRHSYIRSI